jgi:hypothetical protein
VTVVAAVTPEKLERKARGSDREGIELPAGYRGIGVYETPTGR